MTKQLSIAEHSIFISSHRHAEDNTVVMGLPSGASIVGVHHVKYHACTPKYEVRVLVTCDPNVVTIDEHVFKVVSYSCDLTDRILNLGHEMVNDKGLPIYLIYKGVRK